jgi:hypothetical protein
MWNTIIFGKPNWVPANDYTVAQFVEDLRHAGKESRPIQRPKKADPDVTSRKLRR